MNFPGLGADVNMLSQFCSCKKELLTQKSRRPPHTSHHQLQKTALLLSSGMGAPRGDQMVVMEGNSLSRRLTGAHMFPVQRTNLPH